MDQQVGREIPGRHDTPGTRRRRRLGWPVALVVLVLAGAGAWWVLAPHAARQPAGGEAPGRPGRSGHGAPPQPVGAATIGRGDVRVVRQGLGTVTPLATVTVKTQINGQLVQVGFQEGQLVQKGDFLAQIDPRPYQVALEQAQGALARDQAALTDAQLDLKRYQLLLSQDSIARQQVDTQAATVKQDQGTVLTDQANIDSAKLNLVYCHIIAPVGGRVGLRQVDPGNYVQTSDANGLVVLTQLQPISVIFALPEDDLPAITRRTNAGARLPVLAFDRSDADQLAAGTMATTDNQIDTTTGTVKLRADFDNADGMLFPNQFVNAHLVVDTHRNVVVAPTSAIQRGEPGTFVYVVKPDGTVSVQVVKLGPQDGNLVEVESGLSDGETVVTDGADRLRDGAHVTVPPPPGQGGGQGGSQAGTQPQRGAPEQAGSEGGTTQGDQGGEQHRHRRRQQQGQDGQ